MWSFVQFSTKSRWTFRFLRRIISLSFLVGVWCCNTLNSTIGYNPYAIVIAGREINKSSPFMKWQHLWPHSIQRFWCALPFDMKVSRQILDDLWYSFGNMIHRLNFLWCAIRQTQKRRNEDRMQQSQRSWMLWTCEVVRRQARNQLTQFGLKRDQNDGFMLVESRFTNSYKRFS